MRVIKTLCFSGDFFPHLELSTGDFVNVIHQFWNHLNDHLHWLLSKSHVPKN